MKSSPLHQQRVFARVASAALLLAWSVVALNCDTLVPRESWSRKWGPMVPHKTFPGDCGICHYPEGWNVMREDFDFDHEKETGHALEGAHQFAACLRCHNDRGPVDMYLARGCGGCHVDTHKSMLGLDCTRCHTQDTWYPVGLILEHARTRFPLAFNHAVTPCESCHERATVGDYRGAPVECHFCHQRDAAQSVPNHVINNWVRNCDQCHTQVAWGQAPGFNHNFFPLVGAHANLNCLACHASGQLTPLDPNCIACHRSDYLAAPNHVANNFSTVCTDCHNTTAWK